MSSDEEELQNLTKELARLTTSINKVKQRLEKKRGADDSSDESGEQVEDEILVRAIKHPESVMLLSDLKGQIRPKHLQYMREAKGKEDTLEFVGDRVFNLEMAMCLSESKRKDLKKSLFSIYTSNQVMSSAFSDWEPSVTKLMSSDIEISCAVAHLHGDSAFISTIVKIVFMFGEMTSTWSTIKLQSMESLISAKEEERHSRVVDLLHTPASSTFSKIDLNSGPSPYGLLRNHFHGKSPIQEEVTSAPGGFKCVLRILEQQSEGHASSKRGAKDDAALTIMQILNLV